jgi:type II secretory pathway pseudopilin PulG
MANKDIFGKEKKDEYEIKIKITPRRLERTFFIIIILVLAYFAFWGKTGNTDASNTKDTNSAVAAVADTQKITTSTTTNKTENKTIQQPPKEEEPIIVEEEKPVVNETKTTVNTTQANTTNTTQQTPQPKVYNGMINLTVGDIESEKGTYTSSGVNWGKITKVSFTIDNQKEAFMPKVQVYTYNMASSDVMSNMARGEIIYSTQELGEKKEHSLDVESQPFTGDDVDKAIFVKVVLKNQKTDAIIQTIEKQYNFP